MKLWLLRPRKDLPENDDPWDPWYDKAFGFVIRAETEEEARVFANKDGGDETGKVSHRTYRTGGDPWLNSKMSSCEELKPDGEAGTVIQDFHSA